MLASTLTTIAVFLAGGSSCRTRAGQLFRDIAIAISIAVALSLLVSITVIPTLAARILRVSGGRDPPWHDRRHPARGHGEAPPDVCEPLGTGCRMPSAWWSSPRRGCTGCAAPCGGGSWWWWASPRWRWAAAGCSCPRPSTLPEGNRNLILGLLLPPPGYNLQEFEAIGRTIEAELRPYWEAQPGSPEAAQLAGAADPELFLRGPRAAGVHGAWWPASRRKVRDLIPVVYRALAKIPGMIPIVLQQSLFQRNLGEGRSIDVEITGPELERLVQLGFRVFVEAQRLLPGSQVRPIPSLDLGQPGDPDPPRPRPPRRGRPLGE
ncbi:MAG: hypothetical protein KatS3mg131_1603 [Candidatus Tectimicrobiota bacterium]|nr:MAG: hypothetical protein KatS3mg131_1603 [Candidatus Tectomicrobia bacterium]